MRRLIGLVFLIVLFVASPTLAQSRQPDEETSLTFTIVADQRYFTVQANTIHLHIFVGAGGH